MNNDANELNHEKQIFDAQQLKRTNFFISFCYLIFQVLLPGLVLFFLTSKDFSFTFKLPLWLMFVLGIVLIFFTIITTFITYKFKLHQLDQFTYAIPFACFIVALYLSSYWLNYHYFLIRFIIAFLCAIIGIFFTSIILLFVIQKKKSKKYLKLL